MVQLGPYYSISEWWIHLAIFWNFSEGGCPKLEFLWALILQHVNQNKWLRFKTNHGSHFCSNWTKTKRKQKQSGDYIQGIYGRDCICTGNWFGDFRSGWAKLARQGCTGKPEKISQRLFEVFFVTMEMSQKQVLLLTTVSKVVSQLDRCPN